MAEENEESEPSMDNILSSIRKILSEDEQGTEVAGDPPPGEAQSPVTDQETNKETEMTSAMEVSEPDLENDISEPKRELAEDVLAAVAGSANLAASEDVAGPVGEKIRDGFADESNILELTQQMIAQPPPDIGAGDTILSNGPTANSTDALQELAKALLSKRDIAIGNKDMTLEGLVREILRPLLREWLDQNLPYLIERLVKKEIDHMVNRAERLDL
jgi:cell pole-organizing protein PopZ